MRNKLREREEKWREEREKMEGEIRVLEGRVRAVEKRGERKEGKSENIREGDGLLGWKIRELKGRLERKKREKKRKNIIISGIKITEEKRGAGGDVDR